MEIRSALQKIENYLTVVSNLNKTILSEGVMSRDELLLMKKYLYTSIDRIEDIERSLIIDKKEDKSFTPTPTMENAFVPAKQKEIVEVKDNDHIEEVEAKLFAEQKQEIVDFTDDIQAEILPEYKEFVGEVEHPKMVQQQTEKFSVVENIITEDYALNKTETVIENNRETNIVENIITEDYALNKTETVIENNTEANIVENIITEDYALNKLGTVIENITEESVFEISPVIENIITEDYALNKKDETVIDDVTPNVAAELLLADKIEELAGSFIETISVEFNTVSESITAKFEEIKPANLVEELVSKKKDETLFFEHLEKKLNETPQSHLFQMFDEGKEELHESFAANKPFFEPVNRGFDNSVIANSYEQQDTVLVVEKEVETIVEQLTPSSLNDIFKPQTLVEDLVAKSNKTLSESIALNDKFIFVRELFGNQFGEYENALKHLDTVGSFSAAEQYCNSILWNKFNWTERASAAGRFMDLISKKFN